MVQVSSTFTLLILGVIVNIYIILQIFAPVLKSIGFSVYWSE